MNFKPKEWTSFNSMPSNNLKLIILEKEQTKEEKEALEINRLLQSIPILRRN